MTRDIDKAEMALINYRNLLDGYHSRDETMSRTFFEMTQTFLFLSTIMIGWSFLAKESVYIYKFIQIFVAMSGVIALAAFVLDLKGISSSKDALKQGCIAIEKELGASGINLTYWTMNSDRKKGGLERILRRVLGTGSRSYARTSVFIWLLWLLFSSVMLIMPTNVLFNS